MPKKSLILLSLILIFPALSFAATDTKTRADYILVEKKARQLTLYSKGTKLKTYKIALGECPEGPKVKAGDCKTPEGAYIIDAKNSRSGYHLALHISYPNKSDVKRARSLGVSPGGNIMIHGLKDKAAWIGKYHTVCDWTKGCVAVTNDEIDEIWELVPVGTRVEIKP